MSIRELLSKIEVQGAYDRWNESEYPRDDKGQFTSNGNTSRSKSRFSPNAQQFVESNLDIEGLPDSKSIYDYIDSIDIEHNGVADVMFGEDGSEDGNRMGLMGHFEIATNISQVKSHLKDTLFEWGRWGNKSVPRDCHAYITYKDGSNVLLTEGERVYPSKISTNNIASVEVGDGELDFIYNTPLRFDPDNENKPEDGGIIRTAG